ncbi:MAG: hypothetical protein N3A54_07345, partial [Patescibacteria group bacterium]|nr:hypothetical protein [Patescibacteria group bacterium]
LLYRLVFRHFSPSVASITLIGIAFCTNLLFYGSLDTVNSHSSSLFLSTIVITLILEQRSPFLIGVFIGLLAATRTQDGIFVILAAPLLVQRRSFMSFSSFILGCLLGFFPQLLAWQALYGTMLKSPYLSEHHYFNFFQPKLIDVLVYPNNGLLLWTPIIGICLAGLVLEKRILFLLVFILQWYLIASWSFWWQGASFSGRMFISLLPIFSLGLGDLLTRWKPKLQAAIILFFLIYNGGAIMLYLLTN